MIFPQNFKCKIFCFYPKINICYLCICYVIYTVNKMILNDANKVNPHTVNKTYRHFVNIDNPDPTHLDKAKIMN